MNLGDLITRAATYWPNNLAVIDDTQRLTYREFEERTNRLVTGLEALGLTEGSHVGVQGWNCAEMAELEVACYKGGFVKVPMNARLSDDETVHTVNDGQPVAVVAGADHAAVLMARRGEMPGLKYVVAVGEGGDMTYSALLATGSPTHTHANPDDDATAVLHYTSGSSGVLKAAMQSYGARKSLVNRLSTAPWARIETRDVMAHVGPVTHASGMFMMGLFRVGACNLLLSKFDIEDLLQTIEREKVSRLMLVPTMVNRMVNHDGVENYDLSSLRSVVYGAAPMTPAVVEKALNVFGPVVSQGYGAGETASIITVLTEQDHVDALNGDKKRLASCGRNYTDSEVRVINAQGNDVAVGEVGEIVVKGVQVMQGYYNAPELTAEVLKNGVYETGDLAVVDDEGYIFIVDRKKEMIISGGFNVYPLEVEKVLYAHDAIYEAAVVGVPDEEWGEAIKAVVVLNPGKSVTEAEIVAYCKDKLAGFKRPRSVDFIDELPKNPNGKVVRRKVRDTYWGEGRQVN